MKPHQNAPSPRANSCHTCLLTSCSHCLYFCPLDSIFFSLASSCLLLKHHANRNPFAKGYEYSRSANPNRNALEATLASLESGGAHALAFASGSATTATVLQSLGLNAHIVSVNEVYGGTFRYMTRVASENQGLETTFVDLEHADEEAIRDAIRENTKVLLSLDLFFSLN
jgi:cystathionine beta-lyase/cystathionine gamma-synthase